MATRPAAETAELEVLERAAEAGVEERPAKRKRAAKASSDGTARPPFWKRIRWVYVLAPLAAVAAAAAAAFLFHKTESFLINDERFRLAAPERYGAGPPGLTVDGLRRASQAEILRLFEPDLGRSLYLFPLAERRRNLLAVHWVKEASVSRRWPNKVHVSIVEREPVAFAQISQRGQTPRFTLIDTDGVLLPIPKGEKFDRFPVLTGMTGRESENARRTRVQQALHLLAEAGPLAARIPEIDVADAGNAQAMLEADGGVLTLRLGSRDFGRRLNNFIKHLPDIRQRRPDARIFDLRMDDRITAVGGDPNGQ